MPLFAYARNNRPRMPTRKQDAGAKNGGGFPERGQASERRGPRVSGQNRDQVVSGLRRLFTDTSGVVTDFPAVFQTPTTSVYCSSVEPQKRPSPKDVAGCGI